MGEKHTIVLTDGRRLPFHVPPSKHSLGLNLDELEQFCLGKKLEVEIGPGKGEFLARRASRFPERVFIGIDRRDDRCELTEKKLRRSAKNWMILNEDARSLLPKFSERLPSIEILHIYHPDPWPKKRHFKHRFFRSPDAFEWAKRISFGGELRFSTDHKGYFEEILDIIESWNFLRLQFAFSKQAHMAEPQSHFESIFLKKGEAVYKAVFSKRNPKTVQDPVFEAAGFNAAESSASLAR